MCTIRATRILFHTSAIYEFSASAFLPVLVLISRFTQQQYGLNHIPTVFVSTKSDLDLAQQRHEVQPDVYCRRLGLQVPVAVSIKDGQTADLFHAICSVALKP